MEVEKWLLYDSNQNRKRSVGEAQLLVAGRRHSEWNVWLSKIFASFLSAEKWRPVGEDKEKSSQKTHKMYLPLEGELKREDTKCAVYCWNAKIVKDPNISTYV